MDLNWDKLNQGNFDQFNTYSLNEMPKNDIFSDPITRTQQPIVTGTSVLGLKYKDGVMLAADTLASYGSLARFMDEQRLYPVGDFTVLAASGDLSDFQYTKHLLDTVMVEEYYTNDGHVLRTQNIYEYLSRVMYGRRSRFNPLWNSYLVGGYSNNEKFLGYVDLLGVTYQSSTIATGFGSFLAQPILRKAVDGKEDTLTEAEAIEIIDYCMRVLFCRDGRSINKFYRAKINAQGIEISGPHKAKTEWGYGEGLRGYGP